MTSNVARKKRRKKRRRGKKILVLLLVIAVLTLVTYTLSVTVFFNVKSVEIAGSSRYDQQRIIDLSGISAGDNLILLDKSSVSNGICHALPYIGSAKVECKFPDKVRITVTECTPDIAYELDNGYLIASGLKLLEHTDTLPDGLVTVKANLGSYTIGFNVDLPDGANDVLTVLRNSAESAGITDITNIDVSNVSDLSLVCGGKIRLRIGTTESLEKKMNNAVSIIETQRSKYGDAVEGTVDLRYLSDDSNRSYFTRESISEAPSEPVESEPLSSQISSSDVSSTNSR